MQHRNRETSQRSAPPEITNQTQIHAARCNIPVQSHPTALPHSNPCVFYAILALPRRPGTQQMQQCNTQFQISPRKRNEPKPAPVRRQNHQPPATNHQPPRGRRPPTAGLRVSRSPIVFTSWAKPPATSHQPPATGGQRPPRTASSAVTCHGYPRRCYAPPFAMPPAPR